VAHSGVEHVVVELRSELRPVIRLDHLDPEGELLEPYERYPDRDPVSLA
jgi:hypothetical protein